MGRAGCSLWAGPRGPTEATPGLGVSRGLASRSCAAAEAHGPRPLLGGSAWRQNGSRLGLPPRPARLALTSPTFAGDLVSGRCCALAAAAAGGVAAVGEGVVVLSHPRYLEVISSSENFLFP